ncbi:L-asparaginase [Synergistales bacterium]|nr:L-asparaginase [Synergistales bacterium]
MSNRDKIALIFAGGQIILKCLSEEQDTAPLENEEILAILPGKTREAVFVVDWSRQPISHYTLRMCGDLIQLAGRQIEEGAAGVVMTCGTQCLAELAYFADLIWSYPQPLILTSSINYANSHGSETALHIKQAVKAASSQGCWGQGALVCTQDALYAAREVSLVSNYTRAGCVALSYGPVAEFFEPSGCLIFRRSPHRGKTLDIKTIPARHVEILDASLGGGDIVFSALVENRAEDLDGLVISAFGGGDIPPSWVPLLRKIMRANTPIVLASCCAMGRVQAGSEFEGSARHILEMGLISAGTLTPHQARIKLAVGIGAEMTGQALREYMLDE